MSSSGRRAVRTPNWTAWSHSVPRATPERMPPYARGRLVITPMGQGQFTFMVVRGTDKWATRG
jgi:hypothetical protein